MLRDNDNSSLQKVSPRYIGATDPNASGVWNLITFNLLNSEIYCVPLKSYSQKYNGATDPVMLHDVLGELIVLNY